MTEQYPAAAAPSAPVAGKSRLVVGLLGIFLGSIGVHNFYLGFTKKAVIQIVVTVVTFGIGGLWGFIEGILYLASKDPKWGVDADGVPLV